MTPFTTAPLGSYAIGVPPHSPGTSSLCTQNKRVINEGNACAAIGGGPVSGVEQSATRLRPAHAITGNVRDPNQGAYGDVSMTEQMVARCDILPIGLEQAQAVQ